MKQKVGFIGMGIMGVPMASNIMQGGHEVKVFNRTKEKAQELLDKGALWAATPSELTHWADVLIVMLTGPEAINAIIFGEHGLASGDIKGKAIINMSTVSPAYSKELAQRLTAVGGVLIDAPVSGSKLPAQEGTLVILASGPEEKVKENEELLLCMGKKVVYCGTAGQGSAMKMAVNLLLGVMMEGFCEAIHLGQKCGLATEVMLDTLLAGPLSCGLYGLKTEMLKSGEFPAQFPLKHMAKDINFVLATAQEAGAAVPSAETVAKLYNMGLDKKLGDEDFAAVKKILEQG